MGEFADCSLEGQSAAVEADLKDRANTTMEVTPSILLPQSASCALYYIC